MGFLDSVKGALKSAVSGHASKDAATKKNVVVVEEAETAPAAPAAPAAPVVTEAVEPAKLESYTVKAGDTLGEIGARFGASIAEIVTLNNIENPDLIFPGQVFRVPKR